MIGPESKDYKTITRFADTLFSLRLVIHNPAWVISITMSSYVAVCNLGQRYWMEYREKYENSN